MHAMALALILCGKQGSRVSVTITCSAPRRIDYYSRMQPSASSQARRFAMPVLGISACKTVSHSPPSMPSAVPPADEWPSLFVYRTPRASLGPEIHFSIRRRPDQSHDVSRAATLSTFAAALDPKMHTRQLGRERGFHLRCIAHALQWWEYRGPLPGCDHELRQPPSHRQD